MNAILKIGGSLLSGLGIGEILDFLSPEKETPSQDQMLYGIIKYVVISFMAILGIGVFIYYKTKK